MNIVTSFLRSITPTEIPKYLGRWRIDYCKVKINNTIDLANEDHCGTCGQYASNKINLIKTQNEIKDIPTKIIK
jgi:hypothetical protein